jgi:hypothetical protein
MTSVPLMSSSAATRRRSIPQRRRYAPRLSPHSNPGQCTSACFDLLLLLLLLLVFFNSWAFFPVSCCRVMGVLSFWTEMLHSRPRRRRWCFFVVLLLSLSFCSWLFPVSFYCRVVVVVCHFVLQCRIFDRENEGDQLNSRLKSQSWEIIVKGTWDIVACGCQLTWD